MRKRWISYQDFVLADNFISVYIFLRWFFYRVFFFTSLVYVDTLYGIPSRYDRYSELVLTESIVLLDIDDKELPNSLPDICLCMLCLAKEDANPANPFLFDLASGCRATKGLLSSLDIILYFIFMDILLRNARVELKLFLFTFT